MFLRTLNASLIFGLSKFKIRPLEVGMIYDQKIDWRNPNQGMGIVGSRLDPFKSAVLDYQTDIEAEINDLINLHFRDPDAYDVEYAPLKIRIQLARALIGPTPDDDIWAIITAFSKLRNSLPHSATAYTAEGIKKTESQTRNLLTALQKLRPEYTDEAAKDKDWVIAWAAMTVQCFFREIRKALSPNEAL
jgi:hypothetical protein